MKKFSSFICRHKIFILILSIILLIPTLIGIKNTKINYDILVYLPEDIETIKGQNILTEDFNMGAFSVTIIDNMAQKDILKLEDKIKKIDGVEKAISISDLTGTNIPIEILPNKITEKIKKGNSNLMLITFSDGTSSEKTLNAVEEIRNITKDSCKVSGMSSMVLDTMNLSNQEIIIYIVIAVILCIIVLMISLDSYIVPFILLGNIGIAILFNMGTNIFLGQISYITKAISSVLQLGVTTDFSIFLYHKYEKAKNKYKDKNEAMSIAITETLTSVLGSSLTTIAGFLALCTMNLTLGMDIGIVMAKGVLIGVICVITLFPALLLCFDKLIDKTHHKSFVPKFKHIKNFTLKHYKLIFIIFLILVIPAWYGNNNTKVYYNLDKSLPKDLMSSIANKELKEKFDIVSPEIILIDKNLSTNKVNKLVNEIENIEGINLVLSPSMLEANGIPLDIIDNEIKQIFSNDDYQMIFVNSKYDIATNKLNNQIEKLTKIVKKYDKDSIIAGEGPLMKDLVQISDEDFKNVNYSSIAVIFIIMLLVLKSISLPVLLIAAIEFAIFINMGIPYYTNTTIPFIASIVIGTIQLGATIDYAILMTTKYLEERKQGKDKFKSIKSALDNSVNSIFVSSLCFFAATFGVGVYSKLEMIGSLCTLISRGAIISMIVVITVLPSLLIIFDKLIYKTTLGFKGRNNMKNIKKIAASIIAVSLTLPTMRVSALTKDETVYTKLNNDGSSKYTIVNEHLINDELENIEDISDLSDIININGEEKFKKEENKLTWKAKGKDIFYQGKTNKELPITTKITYKLDGEEKDIKDIIGKKGKVEINIKYINNDKHEVTINGKKEQMYTPFIVTMATTFSSVNNSNIKINNGKIVETGNNSVIAGIALPGLYESLGINELKGMDEINISFDTKKFESNSIYMVITPKIIEKEDLKMFDKFDGIYNKINTLKTSVNMLNNGSNELLNGIKLYNNNFNEYNIGIKKLQSGSNLLVNSYSQISNGIKEIDNGMKNMNQLINVIDSLSSNIDYLSTSLNSIASNSNELNNMVNTTINSLQNHIATLQNIALNTTDDNTKNMIYTEINKLQNEIDIQKLNNLTNQINALNNSIQQLNGGMKSLNENTKNMAQSINKLVIGVNTLNNGSDKFKLGLNEFNNSINTLQQATDKLKNGSSTIEEGATKLNDGIEQFNNLGINQINNYTYKFKNLEIKVKTLINLSEEYNSFTMKNNDTIGKTKFIMVIDSIKG